MPGQIRKDLLVPRGNQGSNQNWTPPLAFLVRSVSSLIGRGFGGKPRTPPKPTTSRFRPGVPRYKKKKIPALNQMPRRHKPPSLPHLDIETTLRERGVGRRGCTNHPQEKAAKMAAGQFKTGGNSRIKNSHMSVLTLVQTRLIALWTPYGARCGRRRP